MLDRNEKHGRIFMGIDMAVPGTRDVTVVVKRKLGLKDGIPVVNSTTISVGVEANCPRPGR